MNLADFDWVLCVFTQATSSDEYIQVVICIKNDEFLHEKDEFCIKNDEFLHEKDEFCIWNDEFCIKNDEFNANAQTIVSIAIANLPLANMDLVRLTQEGRWAVWETMILRWKTKDFTLKHDDLYMTHSLRGVVSLMDSRE